MHKVMVDGKRVYKGSYWACCGYISCLRTHAVLLDENNNPVQPQELGY